MSAKTIAEALRIVGGDLDLRGIKTFIARCEPDLFIVRGGYQPPPAVMPVTVHYASRDIDRLLTETDNADCLAPMRDFSSLSEIFSAIGSYVSSKQGRLISISNTASTPIIPIIIVQYATVESDAAVEIFKGSAIYELCVSVYKARSMSMSNRPRRYTRFTDLNEIDQRSN